MRRSDLAQAAVVTAIASGCASLVAAHLAKSARRADRLETQSLTIVDETNHPVAVLSSNSPGLVLFDKERRKRADLFLEPNGTPDRKSTRLNSSHVAIS